jgi:hypothetical protein
MLAIQIILILSLVLVSARLLRGQGARHQAVRRILLIVFAMFGVLSILFPTVWTRLAEGVGVGRGTDLLLYALLMTFLGFVASSYLRFRELENRLTRLARRIALDEVPPPGEHSTGSALPGHPEPGDPGPR